MLLPSSPWPWGSAHARCFRTFRGRGAAGDPFRRADGDRGFRARGGLPPNSVRPTPSCSCCRRQAPATSTKACPDATDAQVLRAARVAAVIGGGRFFPDLHRAPCWTALTMFYSVLVVSLFVPILGAGTSRAREGAARSMGLWRVSCCSPRFTSRRMAAGTDGLSPTLLGLIGSGMVFLVVTAMTRATPENPRLAGPTHLAYARRDEDPNHIPSSIGRWISHSIQPIARA